MDQKTNRLLTSASLRRGVLIAAHRGTKGANIIENTSDAFTCAIKNDADIIELDIVSSTDGILYVFHDGNEKRLLGVDTPIKEMSSEQIDRLTYRNAYGKKSAARVNRLGEVLDLLKGETLINVDRCWDIFDRVICEVISRDMFDQVIFKCTPDGENLAPILACPQPLMFMTMASTPEEIEKALSLDVNLVAVEINFTSEDSPVIDRALLDRLHARGILLWTNALSLKDGWTASAGHDDNLAITTDMHAGWGWLVDLGFDIIQTDWPMLLRRYLNEYCA